MSGGVVKSILQLKLLGGGGGVWRRLLHHMHGPALVATVPCQNGASRSAKLHDQPAREGTVYIHVSNSIRATMQC